MKHSIRKSARPESPLYWRGLGEASYFSIGELSQSATAERLAIDNTPPHAARTMLTILVEQLLDPIRRRYGAPIIVTSGYRCPALNTAVGGALNSHHIVGCAADVTTGSIEQNKQLFALIIEMLTTHNIHFTPRRVTDGCTSPMCRACYGIR